MTRNAEQTFPTYIGWIYGDPEDRTTLEGLGVKGEMIWGVRDNSGSMTVAARKKRGVFAHCECTKEALDRLETEYPAFWRGSFTGTDERAYREYRRQFGEDA